MSSVFVRRVAMDIDFTLVSRWREGFVAACECVTGMFRIYLVVFGVHFR